MSERHPSAPALPTGDRGYRRLGLIILLLAFGGFGGWALTARLAVAVVAPGSVSSASFTRTVQHLEGGIVSEIRVADGDEVAAGEALVVLSDTQARSRLASARSRYLINRAMEVRLLAEQAGAETLAFPAELAESDAPRVQAVLAVQRDLFQARRDSLDSALDALDEQIHQMREQVEGLESRIDVDARNAQSLAAEAEDFRALFREGLGNNQRLRELERQVLEYRGKAAEQRARIASLKSRIGETRLNKTVRQQEFRARVGEQLRDVQAQIAEDEERLTALGDRVERTTLTAPVAGTVTGLKVHSRGDVIRPGEEVMQVVPSGGGFVVEARIPAREIDSLHVGQPAEIRFSAFNQRLTREIPGEVAHLSADTFEDEATGQRFYRARVRVTQRGEQVMTEQMQLLSGMPAEVMIRTGERTFASYIAKPITDMLARAIQEE